MWKCLHDDPGTSKLLKQIYGASRPDIAYPKVRDVSRIPYDVPQVDMSLHLVAQASYASVADKKMYDPDHTNSAVRTGYRDCIIVRNPGTAVCCCCIDGLSKRFFSSHCRIHLDLTSTSLPFGVRKPPERILRVSSSGKRGRIRTTAVRPHCFRTERRSGLSRKARLHDTWRGIIQLRLCAVQRSTVHPCVQNPDRAFATITFRMHA